MRGLVKKGRTWHLDMIVKGVRVRRSTGTDDLQLALNVQAKIRSEIIEGIYYPKPKGDKKLFVELARDFVETHQSYRGRKLSKATRVNYGLALKHLLPVFGETVLSKITVKKIEAYIRARQGEGAMNGTIRGEINFLSVAFNAGIKKGWLDKNPVRDVERPSEGLPRVRYLIGDEAERIYSELPHWVKPIMTFARFTGLRLGNIVGLGWQDVDLFRKTITIQHTKNGERLGLPMGETVFNLLKGLSKVRRIDSNRVFLNKEGNPTTIVAVSWAFRRACLRARVENMRFHDLRHDFCSRLVQKGVDLYAVARLAGHKTITMTARYAHLSPEKLRADIAVLDADNDTKSPQAVNR